MGGFNKLANSSNMKDKVKFKIVETKRSSKEESIRDMAEIYDAIEDDVFLN